MGFPGGLERLVHRAVTGLLADTVEVSDRIVKQNSKEGGRDSRC